MPAKRRAYRKMRKSKRKSSKKVNNTDMYRFTVKQSTTINPVNWDTTKGSAPFPSNYINAFFSTAPGLATQSMTSPLNQSTEFALYRQMFDQFRVHSVTVKVIPRANMTEAIALSATALNTSPNAVTVGRNVYYTLIDRDGPVPSSTSAIKKYSSFKVHKMTSVATRTYAIKYDGRDQWFDCQNTGDIEDVQKSLGLWGGITVYGESFPEPRNLNNNDNPIPWADIELTYRVSFRGKALVGVAVGTDDLGNEVVTLTQPPNNYPDVVVYKNEEQVRHYGAIDLSGNLIQ